MDLVVRVGAAAADGYRDRSRPRIVQVVREERAWLAQCGLTTCSSTCLIM
jgi:hypothetical protein